jgi:hypothetical protein
MPSLDWAIAVLLASSALSELNGRPERPTTRRSFHPKTARSSVTKGVCRRSDHRGVSAGEIEFRGAADRSRVPEDHIRLHAALHLPQREVSPEESP